MNELKVEVWDGHAIRFVWHEEEWWAVAIDVCSALGLKQVSRALSSLPGAGVTISKVGVETGVKRDGTPATQEVEANIINEQNIYRLVFKSRKKGAEEFQDWVYSMLRELRQSTGLEGFQVFRMLDKEHQKEAMAKLKGGLKKPVRVDFIKANTVANKVVSTMYGHPKMIKKDRMTPEMLVQRESVLDDTVELMSAVDKFSLDCSVSKKIREIYH
ncbi:MAG TPA: phage repressor protein [Firmicutes bacterium]|nr:phage repressor protein [Bacillota bacterium]